MCLCIKVLDGSESQYSGMQIGTLQDEEEEGGAPSTQEEPPEPFLQSALGMFVYTIVYRHETGSAYRYEALIMLIVSVCVCLQL